VEELFLGRNPLELAQILMRCVQWPFERCHSWVEGLSSCDGIAWRWEAESARRKSGRDSPLEMVTRMEPRDSGLAGWFLDLAPAGCPLACSQVLAAVQCSAQSPPATVR